MHNAYPDTDNKLFAVFFNMQQMQIMDGPAHALIANKLQGDVSSVSRCYIGQ